MFFMCFLHTKDACHFHTGTGSNVKPFAGTKWWCPQGEQCMVSLGFTRLNDSKKAIK